MRSILAIDQSVTHSAAVHLRHDRGIYHLENQWQHDSTGKGIPRLMRFHGWAIQLMKYAAQHHLVVVREHHTANTYGAAQQLHGLASLLDVEAAAMGHLDDDSYLMVNMGTWKKFMLGRGNFKKDTSYMLHMNKAFEKFKRFHTPDPIADDNIGDAICIGLTAAAIVNYDEWEPELTKVQIDALKKLRQSAFTYGE